jgi:thiamine kinase-like enzyme
VVRIPGAETELFIDRDNELARNNDIIKRIMISIKTIHDRARFKKRFDPFDTIKNYMDNYIEKYNAPLPDDIDWMLSLCSDIEKAMQRNKPPDVACHNDYLSANFMDDGVKIWIIDWEYGGCGDPFFDLGDFAVEHPFSREQEEMIIKEYCGELNYEKLYRMLLHKIIADLWWSLWAMIQSRVSKIDFDFYTYGNKRFERLRKNAMDKDFQKWLDGI